MDPYSVYMDLDEAVSNLPESGEPDIATVAKCAELLHVDPAKLLSFMLVADGPNRSRTQWGVQVGTWPPYEYLTESGARFHVAHPYEAQAQYQHKLVRRTTWAGPWAEVCA